MEEEKEEEEVEEEKEKEEENFDFHGRFIRIFGALTYVILLFKSFRGSCRFH